MRNTMKKCLAWVMTLFMLMTLMPTSTLAATATCPDGEHQWYYEYYDNSCDSSCQADKVCAVCQAHETVTVPAGHIWREGQTYKQPTCTEEGVRGEICDRCWIDREVTIPANGHKWGDWTTTEATCTIAGEKQRTCTVCVAIDIATIPALNHDFGTSIQTKAPTCTEAGKETATCSRCGLTQDKTIPALGHDFGNWVTAEAATCTTEGTEIRNCSRGDATEMHFVDALGHDWTSWNVKTKPGKDVDLEIEQHCARCYIEETDTVPHDIYVEFVTLERKTDEEGVTTSVILEYTITNNGKSDVAIKDYVLTDGLEEVKYNVVSVDAGADALAPGATIHCTLEMFPEGISAALGVSPFFHVMGAQWYAGVLYDAEENQFPSNQVNVLTGWGNQWIAPSLSVVKSVVSKPANGTYFVEGETIEYRVYVTNNGNCDLETVYVYDEDNTGIVLMGVPVDIAVGETFDFPHYHDVTKEDVDRGFVVNVAFAVGWVKGGDLKVVEESNAVLSYAGDKKIGILDDDDDWTFDEETGSFTTKGSDGSTDGSDGSTGGKTGDGEDFGIDWDKLIQELTGKDGSGTDGGSSSGDGSTGTIDYEGSEIFKDGFGIEWNEYFKKGKETSSSKLNDDGGFCIDWEALKSSDRYGDIAKESGKGCLRTLIPCKNDHFEYSRDNCEYHTKIDEQAIQMAGNGSLENWTKVKDLWKEELLKMYDLIHDATKNVAIRVLISAEKETFLAQIDSYESTLKMVYATHPEVVEELMASEYRNKVTDLCWMIHNMPENLEFKAKDADAATSMNTECRMILVEETTGHALYAIDTCSKHDAAGQGTYALLDNKATDLDWINLERVWESALFESMFGRYAAVYMNENKAIGSATKNDQNAYLEWVKNYMSLIGVLYQNDTSAHKALTLTFMERALEICGTTDGKAWIHKPDAEKPHPFSGEEVTMPEVTEVTEVGKTTQTTENAETSEVTETAVETETKEDKKFPVAAVAGGGVGALAVIGGVVAFLMKKKKK